MVTYFGRVKLPLFTTVETGSGMMDSVLVCAEVARDSNRKKLKKNFMDQGFDAPGKILKCFLTDAEDVVKHLLSFFCVKSFWPWWLENGYRKARADRKIC